MTFMTYETEADRLAAEYDRAIGDALELGIRVYHSPGGRMKSLGELRDEIADAKGYGQQRRAFYGALADALERRGG